jgi:eukaryotic-like serine/threonine-protein kinase
MSDDNRQDGAGPRADVTYTHSATGGSGSSIGPYRLLECIGEGGMGEVWLAQQTQPVRRQVALKLIKAGMDTKQVIARFEAERQALAMMNHPAIARVFDAGATPQGRPYFAMEYVRGESLTAYSDRGRLTTEQRLDLFLHVCDGVQHAHQKGVIHRDLKPSNILVTLQDDQPAPKIIDFGVAKAMSQPLTEHTLYTSLGGLIGTPEYMSPEQAEIGGVDIDTRTDVYALGVVLYELMTGVLPFDRQIFKEKGLDEIRRTIREVDAPRPSTRVSQLVRVSTETAANRNSDPVRLARLLRGDLDCITMKALEKDRARRYGSVSDLAADLRRHLDDQPVLASPPSTAYKVQKFVRRNRLMVTAAAAIFVLLLVFAGMMAVLVSRIAAERDRATRESATTTQVLEFVEGLFTVSDPSETRGNTLTAREILDLGAARIDRELAGQPEVQSRLMAMMGKVYVGLGLYAVAEPLLQNAVIRSRATLGQDAPQTLRALHELANLRWWQNRSIDAEPLYLEVAERRRRVLGEGHPDSMRVNYDLASLYNQQKRWADAERLLRATLEAQRKVLGEEHVDTLRTMSELASTLHGQQRYAEALALEARATEVRLGRLGQDHVDTILGSHNLANLNYKLGRYEEAEPIFLKTIEAKRRVFGPAHPLTIITIIRLAEMYEKQKRYDKSEAELRAAFDALTRAKTPDPNTIRQTVERLANLYDAWGKPLEAGEWRAKLQQ